jgi:hypothetical protein
VLVGLERALQARDELDVLAAVGDEDVVALAVITVRPLRRAAFVMLSPSTAHLKRSSWLIAGCLT